MERFAELAHSTLQTEMDLHRAYAADWGISREELERERPHAATRAYADFLLRTAALADFGELVAALLPCMWGYSELGQRLAQDRRPTEERYARWIEMYSGEEFANLARWCREVCDEAANSAGEEGKGGCERRSWQAVATSPSSGSKPGATRLEVHRSPRSRRWRPSLARPASFRRQRGLNRASQSPDTPGVERHHDARLTRVPPPPSESNGSLARARLRNADRVSNVAGTASNPTCHERASGRLAAPAATDPRI